ncbi:3334_t:CDS:2 [Entrophospora sp. SA101]|nr:172_t:CDS:2 [Entrophospora sp. SA101]CAJ0828143.1 9673_t:CDS:2 [Entrophospora sp. SA101]CAJ0830541.1 5121_t:CDS:2 [Entrophospora sp. SA101]CAJ0846888.1 3334_t:CDS:2 [Entrophospora sp. SA101]
MWEVEEDIELSQRISVCVIRPKIGGGGDAGDIDTEDSEYQLIQSQKHSTYAAAAKLVSPAGLLSREVAASGDTNRDPEFVKYKIYKKSLNYKTTTKSKEKKKKLEVF